MHAVKSGTERIVVLSSDTDVFVLLMHYWQLLHSSGLLELWLRAGVGDTTRYIPVHTIASRVGKDLCCVLPAVHTLTGCDYTSKIGTKHAAMKANPVKYLMDFGSATCSMDNVFSTSEAYLVQVLKNNTKCTTMNQLRSHMYYHNKSISLDKLPPTSHATNEHIRRAYYATNKMTTLLHTPSAVIDATSFGFEEVDELLMPTRAVKPIPKQYTILCNCLKCNSDKCICRKHGLPCLKFCKCQSSHEHKHVSECKNPSGCVQ